MSTPANDGEKSSSRRRRQSGDNADENAAGGGRPSRPRRTGPRKPKQDSDVKAEAAPKREREPRTSVPVDASLVGKTATGIISATLNRGRGRFGFIDLGAEISDSAPRIYFNFANFSSGEYKPRRGYPVEFEVSNDESDRIHATNVRLTSAGLEVAAAREAHIASERAASTPATKSAASSEPAKAREPRARRERRVNPEDDRTLDLQVTCHGIEGSRPISVQVSNSIGKLKHACVEAFEAPVTFNVFALMSTENPSGVFLTKAVLRTLSPGDVIHIREPTAEEAVKVTKAK